MPAFINLEKGKFPVMKCRILFLVTLFLLTTTGAAIAQPPIKDAWLWGTLSLDKKLSKKFTVDLDEELRMFDNMSRVNLFFTNLSLEYKLSKTFHFAVAYRFINKNQDTYYSQRHRVYVDASYRKKWKQFTFVYRLRLQGQMRDIHSSDKGYSVETYMRHKFDLQYSYKKFKPYLAAEFRYQFTNPRDPGGDDLWDRGRYYAGCEYDFNKKNELNLYYMIQHDYNIPFYEEDFTTGIQFTHHF